MMLAGLALALQEAGATPAAPRPRGWEDFPVFVWRERYKGRPLPEELAEPFGGVILMREEDSGWARERGLSYLVWNVAGRDALHLDADEAWQARVEKWIETRDESLLVREPCLNDPETVRELLATLDRTIAKHGKEPGLGFVLGDEVSWTPNGDPFDLCSCKHCQDAWKVYAKENGCSERAPSTDEVRLYLLEDDYSSLGAWLARRRFNSDCLMRLLERLCVRGTGRDETHHGGLVPRSKPRVGLLGLSGSSPFGGLDPWRATRTFDFLESYPRVEARESMVASWHLADHRATWRSTVMRNTLATVFIEQETPDGAAWRAWEHWLRGGSGLVLWSDTSLLEHPQHLTRLTEAVRDIRALKGVRPDLEQRAGAIVADADSAAAAFLRDALLDGPTWPRRRAGYQAEHGRRERRLSAWLRSIEDAGALPAVVPLHELERDCARWFGFLVLIDILVLRDLDLLNLEKFLDEGGTLIIDGALGWVDRTGRPRNDDALARLRERGGARVLEAPAWIDSYLETRHDPARSSVARGFLRGLLESRASRPRVEEFLAALPPGSLPWLVNRRIGSAQELGAVLTLLPNAVTAAQRSSLGDRDLRPFPHEGIVWIHPRDGMTLRAGDAAVLRLEKNPAELPLDDPLRQPR